MNRREGFKAMNVKVIVLPKRNLNYKLKLVLNEDWGKRLPPLLSRILCGLLLFVDDHFLVRFSGALVKLKFCAQPKYFILLKTSLSE